MPRTLIESNPTFKKELQKGAQHIDVAEFFTDTIQGENFMGFPATFLRLQGCTQACIWCDTQAVWRFGNPYTFSELFEIMEKNDVVNKLADDQHLVLTGGSPLKQQNTLIGFIETFMDKYGFKPFIEIENECTIMPEQEMLEYVDIWNNSPKLRSSKNADYLRYQPEIIKRLASLDNSFFKFVISSEEDWQEIKTDFIDTLLVRLNQIVLMPLGATRDELEKTRSIAVEIACRENVRYSDRLHIIIWNKKTGV